MIFSAVCRPELLFSGTPVAYRLYRKSTLRVDGEGGALPVHHCKFILKIPIKPASYQNKVVFCSLQKGRAYDNKFE